MQLLTDCSMTALKAYLDCGQLKYLRFFETNIFYFSMKRTLIDLTLHSPNFENIILTNEQQDRLRDPDCAICLGEIRIGCVASATVCGHVYHYACLIPHLMRHIT